MNYTTEKPTVPGWYLVRGAYANDVLAHACRTDSGRISMFDGAQNLAECDGVQFAGPIEGWQPIATAPKDDSKILILFDSASVAVVRLCWWNDGGMAANGGEPDPESVGWWSSKHSVTDELIDWMTPVAWMPMPNCPREFGPGYDIE